MSLPKRHKPGTEWRMLAWSEDDTPIAASSDGTAGTFDELVVDRWLHLEQMSTRHWWMRLGPLHVNVVVGERGEITSILVEHSDDNQHEPCEVDLTDVGGDVITYPPVPL